METDRANVEAIAQALADAHTLNRPAVDAAFQPPADLAEAAEVQAAVARRLDAHVAGWKVGYTPDGKPVAGPIFDRFMKPSGAHFPLREASLWGVEPEIGIKFRLEWHEVERLDGLRLLPSFLRERLRSLPERVEHVVHHD